MSVEKPYNALVRVNKFIDTFRRVHPEGEKIAIANLPRDGEQVLTVQDLKIILAAFPADAHRFVTAVESMTEGWERASNNQIKAMNRLLDRQSKAAAHLRRGEINEALALLS
jgi:hypothetical protein